MTDRRPVGTGVLPHRDVTETLVVAGSLSLSGLVLLAKVGAARLLARQRVTAHELAEIEEVRHPAGDLERLVQLGAGPGDRDVLPELLPQRGNPPERRL